jgi:hypothetical protein
VKTIKPTATTLSLRPTTAGTYVYTITCGGTQSASVTLTVTGSTKTATTTTFTTSPTAPLCGQTVDASVTVTGTQGVPTGTVTFYVGSLVISPALSLSGGKVTWDASTAGVAAGTYPVDVVYSGDANNDSSTSSAKNVTLTANSTSTTLSITPNPIDTGSSATLLAVVARTGSGATGVPAGTVNFYAAGSLLLNSTPVTLNGQGQATYTASTNGVPAGTYPITAVYSPDAEDKTSTSNVVEEVVN